MRPLHEKPIQTPFLRTLHPSLLLLDGYICLKDIFTLLSALCFLLLSTTHHLYNIILSLSLSPSSSLDSTYFSVHLVSLPFHTAIEYLTQTYTVLNPPLTAGGAGLQYSRTFRYPIPTGGKKAVAPHKKESYRYCFR